MTNRFVRMKPIDVQKVNGTIIETIDCLIKQTTMKNGERRIVLVVILIDRSKHLFIIKAGLAFAFPCIYRMAPGWQIVFLY